VNDAATGAVGRGMPAGGISPVLNLRSTLSSSAALLPAFATSIPLSATPAVGFFWLWHPAQYWSSRGRGLVACDQAAFHGEVATAKRARAVAWDTTLLPSRMGYIDSILDHFTPEIKFQIARPRHFS
jgi:hypothetical protein